MTLKWAVGRLLAALLLSGGCSSKIVVLRPHIAHPDQTIEVRDEITSVEDQVRTSVRYMQGWELDALFRPAGSNQETANPFLYWPPRAPVKFTVFRIYIRNESAMDIFQDLDTILLRDEPGNEYHPEDKESLTTYWLRQVTMELGNPITWTGQTNAVQETTTKRKSLTETMFTGGHLPPRSERQGYIAFRNVSETGKPKLVWYQKGFMRTVEFILLTPLGRYFIIDRLFKWGPPHAIPIGHVQLNMQLVTRDSQYGPPRKMALKEFNFHQVRISVPPEGDKEMDPWRKQ